MDKPKDSDPHPPPDPPDAGIEGQERGRVPAQARHGGLGGDAPAAATRKAPPGGVGCHAAQEGPCMRGHGISNRGSPVPVGRAARRTGDHRACGSRRLGSPSILRTRRPEHMRRVRISCNCQPGVCAGALLREQYFLPYRSYKSTVIDPVAMKLTGSARQHCLQQSLGLYRRTKARTRTSA